MEEIVDIVIDNIDLNRFIVHIQNDVNEIVRNQKIYTQISALLDKTELEFDAVDSEDYDTQGFWTLDSSGIRLTQRGVFVLLNAAGYFKLSNLGIKRRKL